MAIKKPLYVIGDIVEFKLAGRGIARLKGKITDIKVDEDAYYKIKVDDSEQGIHGDTIVYEDKIIKRV
jgi:hypothetical protein